MLACRRKGRRKPIFLSTIIFNIEYFNSRIIVVEYSNGHFYITMTSLSKYFDFAADHYSQKWNCMGVTRLLCCVDVKLITKWLLCPCACA
jgi:hypothetical protein